MFMEMKQKDGDIIMGLKDIIADLTTQNIEKEKRLV